MVLRGFLDSLIELTLESAPALLLAFLFGGIFQQFFPQGPLDWLRRGKSFSQALRGALLGVPFPLCSCSVLPLYRSFISRGVPATAGLAFMIASPEINIPALLLSFPLLGVELTFARILSALLVALLVGWIVGRGVPARPRGLSLGVQATARTASQRLVSGLRYGFVDIVDHTAPWILLGLLLAAVLSPLVSHDWLAGLPGWLEVPLFALIGLPAYVCASGTTPLVAVLLLKGLSPGAAVAFLLTGPATNISTFGILAKTHDKRVALRFALAIFVASIVAGYLTNFFLAASASGNIASEHEPHGMIAKACAAIFAIMMLASMIRQGFMGFWRNLHFFSEEHSHPTK